MDDDRDNFFQAHELRELVSRIERLKSEGKRVGLCCGVFDMLHPGHVMHLNSAKRLCDVLVVAITADVHVRKRKGPGRPVFDDHQRAYMVTNLKSVDFAIVCPYETAVEFIEALKPDRYIKGPDIKNFNSAGIDAEREVVHSIGGEVVYTDDEKLSTTDFIERIRNS